jgi:hypothetical protein
MTHQKECFISRLNAGIRIWDLKNPEPNETLDEDEWIYWYQRRVKVEKQGIQKLESELGKTCHSEEGLPFVIPPCTCSASKKEKV